MKSFTKQKRRQILAMDLAECILYGIGKAGTKADKGCVSRIRKQRSELVKIMFGTEKFLDTTKKQKLYSHAVNICTNHIDHVFEKLGSRSNDAIWFNVLVYLFERVMETVPAKCTKQRAILDRARGSAATMCGHHEWAVEDEELGMYIGENLMWKIEGAV